MNELLLSVHVIAAIVFIGPVTVAVSLFPRYAREAAGAGAPGALPAVHLLHRITRVYAVLALVVPVFGIATALALDVLTDAWLLVSMLLTAIAGLLLALVVLPRQAQVRAVLDAGAGDQRVDVRALAMGAGVFNLLWATVVVLMIARPGSTTGV
ncbi:hypothetical protein [Modestobacter versicolor]|uniref:DUF2269 domain-containing protein n=1 Tax=Modestobacter versicolor TaxID=429133 RepID=A0A323V4Y4_9ACTN|nr:hypothetical protein [Modestobacter versicolor]MBB3677622.1 hypothetical protein [Modestobacter versicolor]PZA19120.1 hypothetical protein DMO24_22435 [Modestobacter versicolor]